MEFYKPVISIAIEPKTHADQEKIDEVLEKFTIEDPTLTVTRDEDTGQTILSGMGELHLEIIISRMLREFKTDVNVGNPQVVYRESIGSGAQGKAVFEREISGKTHFADVDLEVTPLERGKGLIFRSEVPDDDIIPQTYIPAIEKGIKDGLESGPLKGYPVVDLEVVLTGGSFNESQSSDLAFSVCAGMAVREALEKADLLLLEPIMDVEIFVPDSHMGDAIADLNARGGKIESITPKGNLQEVRATVSLSKMFGYSTALRSATQGRGTFTMQFSRFDNP